MNFTYIRNAEAFTLAGTYLLLQKGSKTYDILLAMKRNSIQDSEGVKVKAWRYRKEMIFIWTFVHFECAERQ